MWINKVRYEVLLKDWRRVKEELRRQDKLLAEKPVPFKLPTVDKKAVEYLKSNPNTALLLVGHSDLIGAERYNINLSKDRAESVKKALVAKGIGAARIQTKGEGYKYPLASNDQEEDGRELNRRVEFNISR